MRIIKGYLKTYAGFGLGCTPGILAALINNICGGIIFFLSFYFVKILHFNAADAGLIISAYGCGKITGAYLGGKLSDRLSLQFISLVSLIIEAIIFILLFVLHTFVPLVITLFLYGITTYTFKVSNSYFLIQQCAKDLKLKMINVLYIASNFGIGISAAIVSLLSFFGFQYIFLLSFGLLFISIALLLTSPKLNHNIENMTDIVHENTKHTYPAIFYGVLLCVFFVGLIISERSTVYSLYVHHQFPSMGLHGISLLFALNPVMIVLFQHHLVKAVENYNKLLIVGLGAFLMGASMFLLNYFHLFTLIVVACATYTVGEMLFFSIAQYLCYQSSSINQKGKSLGLFQMVYAVSMLIGPSIGGWTYFQFGGKTVWDSCGILGTLCLLVCCFLFTNTRPYRH